MGNQQTFNFGRIHIHATGDDGEVFTVGEVEKAFFVEVSHIPHGAPAMLIEGVLGFLGLVEVLKGSTVGEVHVTHLARPQHLAALAQNSRLADDGLADGALVSEPVCRIDNGEAVALAT